jgi:hypothetical protein
MFCRPVSCTAAHEVFWIIPVSFSPMIFRRAVFAVSFLPLMLALGSHAQAKGGNLLENPGFESAGAIGWNDNNWAKLDAEYALDAQNPHSGRYSKRVTLRKLGPSDLQLVQLPAGLIAGESYRLRFWLKGRSNTGAVDVRFRQMSVPYRTSIDWHVSPGEAWKEYVFDFTMPADPEPSDLGLIFSIRDETTFWIDDVSLSAMPSISDEPPVAGNRIRNGSFEVGRDGWSGTFRERSGMADGLKSHEANVGADFLPVAVSDAPVGKRVLQFTVNDSGRAMLTTTYFPLRYGHAATIGFWMKTDRPEKTILARLANGNFPNITWQGREFTSPDTKWHRYTFSVLPKPEFGGRYCLEFNTADVATFSLDDVTATEDGLPAAAPAAFLAGSEPAPGGDPANLFDKDQPANFILHVQSDRPRALSGRVIDVWGKTIQTISLKVPATTPASGVADVRLSLPTALYGGFKCIIDDPAGGKLPAAEILYAVLPKLKPASEVKDPFFGTHVELTPYNLHIAERAGFRLLRLWPPLITIWAAVEPTPGEWNFETRGMARATQMGFRFLGMLGCTPPAEADATADQAAASNWYTNWPPRDWEAWRGYITKTLAAYGPYIKEWEIWNEPDGGGFLMIPPGKKRPEVYAEIVKNAAPVLPFPDKFRFSGGVVTTLARPFTKDVLDLGVGSLVDTYSTHYYEIAVGIGPEENEIFLSRLADIRGRKNRQGEPLEVLVTEFSVDKIKSWLDTACLPGGGLTVAEAAATLTRVTVALKALGIREAYQYAAFAQPAGRIAYRDGFSDYIEINGAPRPALAAQATMARFLEDATAAGLKVVDVGTDRVTIASFVFEKWKIDVVWSRKRVPLGDIPAFSVSGCTAYDLMGNPIPLSRETLVSPDPIYLIQSVPPR